MIKLNAADKKLLDAVKKCVVVGEKTLVELLMERAETLEMPDWALKIHQHTWPEKETVERILFNYRIGLTEDLHSIALSRRFQLDDPRQIAMFTAFGLRSEWLINGHLTWPWATLSGLSPIVALVCNDRLMMERFDTLPCPLVELPGNKKDPLLKNKVSLDMVLGIIRDRRDVVEGAIDWFERLPKDQLSSGMRSEFSGYRAILDRDPQQFLESMEYSFANARKLRGLISPSFKLFNLGLHCVYELALLKDPKLVENWDHERGLPWDADFHRWRRNNEEPLTAKDLEGLDEDRKRLLLDVPVPQWWSYIEQYPVPLPS
jgi:hypothetical protein